MPDAIVQDVGGIPPIAVRHRRPESLAGRGDALEQLFVERPRRPAGRVERAATPAVHHELHVAARVAFGHVIGRAQRFVIRIAHRDERQRFVVQHDVDDNRPAGGLLGVTGADAAPGVQQPPLFGAERRCFFEDFPLAAGFPPPLRARQVFGQIGREAADQRPFRAVELDGCGQAIGRQIGLRPDAQRRLAEGFARRRYVGERRRRPRSICSSTALTFFLKPIALLECLLRILLFDQPPEAAVREVQQRRVEHERGDEQDHRPGDEPQRLGRMAIPGPAPRQPPRQREAREARKGRGPRRHG